MTAKLYAMTCGRLVGRLKDMIEGEDGQVALPIPSYLIEHPKGPINWMGKRWNVAPYEIWVADHIDMNVGDTGHHQIGDPS